MQIKGKSASPSTQECRKARQRATPGAQSLWRVLRNRQVLGFKFRRQERVGNYVVDFYCHEKRLIIEFVDEQPQDSAVQAHQERDAYFASAGFKVLRFTNQRFEDASAQALVTIMEALSGVRYEAEEQESKFETGPGGVVVEHTPYGFPVFYCP
jgi:very-short-patch-repair endonuclease